MGFGHLRAAHSLRDIACGDVLVASEKDRCSPREYLLWQRFRTLYYFMSRGESIPVVGRLLFRALHELQKIPTFYPARDLSRPDLSTRYVANLVRHRDLCRLLLETVGTRPLPVVHTFFATALSFDLKLPEKKDNYLLICDSDFHRVWVPEDPQRSSLRYLAPGTRVKRRLMAYGVPEERIFLTGFPLPRENIGSRGSLEVLRTDLFDRLLRLDPQRNFFAIHGRTVEYFLQKTPPPARTTEPFTVMFAVGGSGVAV
jgi:hypothetical protein